MNYFEFKLDFDDLKECNQLVQAIQQLKSYINNELEEIVKLLNQRIHDCLKLRDYYNLQQFEDVFFNNDNLTFEQQFNNLITHQNVVHAKQNILQIIKRDHFKFFSLVPAVIKLKEVQNVLRIGLCNVKSYIQQNLKQNTQVIQGNLNDQVTIWRHQTLQKNGQQFKSFSLKKGQGFAETFLCKSGFNLKGIILAQLFQGINAQGQQVNYQNQNHTLEFSIHEGLDLSIPYYQQEIELDHQVLIKNDFCYEIILNQTPYLRKGMTYSITLIPKSNTDIITYQYAGKQGDNSQLVKFLDKQIDLIEQIVTAQQSLSSSPLPGLIIKI